MACVKNMVLGYGQVMPEQSIPRGLKNVILSTLSNDAVQSMRKNGYSFSPDANGAHCVVERNSTTGTILSAFVDANGRVSQTKIITVKQLNKKDTFNTNARCNRFAIHPTGNISREQTNRINKAIRILGLSEPVSAYNTVYQAMDCKISKNFDGHTILEGTSGQYKNLQIDNNPKALRQIEASYLKQQQMSVKQSQQLEKEYLSKHKDEEIAKARMAEKNKNMIRAISRANRVGYEQKSYEKVFPNVVFNRGMTSYDHLFRVIRPNENPAAGLSPANPYNFTSTRVDHATKGNTTKTRDISETKSIAVAIENAFMTGNRVMHMQVSQTPEKKYDMEIELADRGVTARNYAFSESEVITEGRIEHNDSMQILLDQDQMSYLSKNLKVERMYDRYKQGNYGDMSPEQMLDRISQSNSERFINSISKTDRENVAELACLTYGTDADTNNPDSIYNIFYHYDEYFGNFNDLKDQLNDMGFSLQNISVIQKCIAEQLYDCILTAVENCDGKEASEMTMSCVKMLGSMDAFGLFTTTNQYGNRSDMTKEWQIKRELNEEIKTQHQQEREAAKNRAEANEAAAKEAAAAKLAEQAVAEERRELLAQRRHDEQAAWKECEDTMKHCRVGDRVFSEKLGVGKIVDVDLKHSSADELRIKVSMGDGTIRSFGYKAFRNHLKKVE